MQGGERNTREPAGDAPLQAAEGQRPNQPDQTSPQSQVRLAAAAMHADPLAVHGLQFRLYREDEDFDVGQGIPAVATAGSGNMAGPRQRQIDTAA